MEMPLSDTRVAKNVTFSLMRCVYTKSEECDLFSGALYLHEKELTLVCLFKLTTATLKLHPTIKLPPPSFLSFRAD